MAEVIRYSLRAWSIYRILRKIFISIEYTKSYICKKIGNNFWSWKNIPDMLT